MFNDEHVGDEASRKLAAKGGDWQHQPTPRCLDEVDFDRTPKGRGPKVAFLKLKWSQATGKDKLPDCFGLLLIGFSNPQEIFLLPFGCISDAVPLCGSRRHTFPQWGRVLFVDIQTEVLNCKTQKFVQSLWFAVSVNQLPSPVQEIIFDYRVAHYCWSAPGHELLALVICQWKGCHRYKMDVYAAKLFPSLSHVNLQWLWGLHPLPDPYFCQRPDGSFSGCILVKSIRWRYDFLRFPFFLLGIQGYDYMVPPCNPAAHDQKTWYVVPGFFLSLGAAKWMMFDVFPHVFVALQHSIQIVINCLQVYSKHLPMNSFPNGADTPLL